jgi:hypothetical protein
MSSQLLGVLIGGLIGLAGATLTPWLGPDETGLVRKPSSAYLVSISEIAQSRGHVAKANALLEQRKAGKN